MHRAKYQLIKDELLEEINSGLFKPGQKFYSESELKSRYGVSTATILRAIQELVNEEYIVRYQGKGSFVSKAKRNERIIFSETDNQLVGIQSIKMVSCTLENETEILDKLKIQQDGQYYKIVRARYNNKKPFAIQVSHICFSYIKDESLLKSGSYQSLYELLRDSNNLDMYSMPFTQTIDITKVIPQQFSDYLQLAEDTPVVLMRRLTLNNDKEVIEYVETYKTIDTFHIEIRNT
ncbi:GntR family transcriptional regulator [Providencia stuartii]|uniref:GntR family transcriptional regulator n=1 Tax=Providencia stuartii TaxID=588 RepID=UPI00112485BA|nr:GntR family transcriptional regulator [Providencia stuartii]